jgi:hypothetical protein
MMSDHVGGKGSWLEVSPALRAISCFARFALRNAIHFLRAKL